MSGHRQHTHHARGRGTSHGPSPGPAPQGHQMEGNGREVFLQALSGAQADLLTGPENRRKVNEIEVKSGADVRFDPNPSPVPGTKIVVLRGSRSQIEVAARLICQKTGAQGSILSQAQSFWKNWVEASFPQLETRAYFLPPVYMNRVPIISEMIAGHQVLILTNPGEDRVACQPRPFPAVTTASGTQGAAPQPPPVSDCYIRGDAAVERVLHCLNEMSKKTGEVMVCLSELQFWDYIGDPNYAAAAAQLPVASTLPSSYPKTWRKGDFDVLLIHRHYGFVVFEVKATGDRVTDPASSPQDFATQIRKKLKQAASQLEKAAAMLSHLVSDLPSYPRITRTIAVPNLTARQVQQAIAGDQQIAQDLCRCLGITDPADISDLCLCSDQLSDPQTHWDVNEGVMGELCKWWRRRVAGYGTDSHMTSDVYKILVARFCGPATTMTVPCISKPRLCIKTLGEAVSWTGACYTQITLVPDQAYFLRMAYPRLFIAGLPGTGKTVLLLLVATEWLLRGEDVYVLSSCTESQATSIMLHYLLLQQIQTARCAGTRCGQVYFVHYFFCDEVDKAVDDFLQKAKGGPLHIVIDEPGQVHLSHHLKNFCEKLLAQVPSLHLWATRVYLGNIPHGWLTGCLNIPLRFPPVVMREVAKSKNRHLIQKFAPDRVRSFTEGPSVEIMCHQGQGHSYRFEDCVGCGWNLGLYLRKLGVTGTPTQAATSDSTPPPSLQYKDVLILHLAAIGEDSGMVRGLREVGIPVRLRKDASDLEDVATARSDVVWMAVGDNVIGLERKIVVCLEPLARGRDQEIRLLYMSRSTSQLVLMLRQPFHSRVPFHDLPSVRNHLGGALAVRRGNSEMVRAMLRKQESISTREIHCCLLHSD